MKTPSILLFCIFSLLIVLNSATAQNQTPASLEIILIEASNATSGTDGSLKSHASTLQRLFKFNSYREVSRKTTQVPLPGTASVNLGNSTELQIKTGSREKTLSADLNWKQGNRTLVHTRLGLSKGKPAVLGGPRSDKGNYLILVIWKK